MSSSSKDIGTKALRFVADSVVSRYHSATGGKEEFFNLNQIWHAQYLSAPKILIPVLRRTILDEESFNDIDLLARYIQKLRESDEDLSDFRIAELEQNLARQRKTLRKEQIKCIQERGNTHFQNPSDTLYYFDPDNFIHKAYVMGLECVPTVVQYAPNPVQLGGAGPMGVTGTAEEALLRCSDLLLHLIEHIEDPQAKKEIFLWYLEQLRLTFERKGHRFNSQTDNYPEYQKEIEKMTQRYAEAGAYNLLAKKDGSYQAFLNRDILLFPQDHFLLAQKANLSDFVMMRREGEKESEKEEKKEMTEEPSIAYTFCDGMPSVGIDKRRTLLGGKGDNARYFTEEDYIRETEARLAPYQQALLGRHQELSQEYYGILEKEAAAEPILPTLYVINIPVGCQAFAGFSEKEVPAWVGQAVGTFLKGLTEASDKNIRVLFTGFLNLTFKAHLNGAKGMLGDKVEVECLADQFIYNENGFQRLNPLCDLSIFHENEKEAAIQEQVPVQLIFAWAHSIQELIDRGLVPEETMSISPRPRFSFSNLEKNVPKLFDFSDDEAPDYESHIKKVYSELEENEIGYVILPANAEQIELLPSVLANILCQNKTLHIIIESKVPSFHVDKTAIQNTLLESKFSNKQDALCRLK